MEIDKILQIAVDALEDTKGQNIVVIDTSKLSPLFSKIVICTGSSTTNVSALASNVETKLRDNGVVIIGTEGRRGGEWVLVDVGDIVIHVMIQNVRTYYDLESLWNEERSS